MASTVMMVPAPPPQQPMDTQHQDTVHDAQIDFFGTKLATCSSDKTIKVYDISDQKHELLTTITGHEGPVYEVAWAHPQWGPLLASCSLDGSIRIYGRDHKCVHIERTPTAMHSIAFCESTLQLAAVGADDQLRVLVHREGVWHVQIWGNEGPALGVCWAPKDSFATDHLITAGQDGYLRLYAHGQLQTSWKAHDDWIRDVAWSPSLVPDWHRFASCAHGSVKIWTQKDGGDWTSVDLPHTWNDPVWRVSWSFTGHMLAVSAGEGDVTLWKAGIDTNTWSQVETVPEGTAAEG